MKKLTSAQLQKLMGDGKQQSCCALITAAAWDTCVRYLHAQLTDPDPVSASHFAEVMLLIKMFVDWALTAAKARYGELAHQCLLLATQKECGPELQHTLNEVPCIFTGRRRVQVYESSEHPSPTPVSMRLQCNFTWWDFHADTGLQSPHESPSFVYESHFSFLIQGMYALGHLGDILKAKAQSIDADHDSNGATQVAAKLMWKQVFQVIQDILAAVYGMLVTRV